MQRKRCRTDTDCSDGACSESGRSGQQQAAARRQLMWRWQEHHLSWRLKARQVRAAAAEHYIGVAWGCRGVLIRPSIRYPNRMAAPQWPLLRWDRPMPLRSMETIPTPHEPPLFAPHLRSAPAQGSTRPFSQPRNTTKTIATLESSRRSPTQALS